MRLPWLLLLVRAAVAAQLAKYELDGDGADSSGNGVDGTLLAGAQDAWYVECPDCDPDPGALDCSQDALALPSGALLGDRADWTLLLSLKHETRPSSGHSQTLYVEGSEGETAFRNRIGLHSSQGLLFIDYDDGEGGSGSVAPTPDVALPHGEWTMLAVRRQDDAITFHLPDADTGVVGYIEPYSAAEPTRAVLGSYAGSDALSTDAFGGQMGEATFYDEALSDDALAALLDVAAAQACCPTVEVTVLDDESALVTMETSTTADGVYLAYNTDGTEPGCGDGEAEVTVDGSTATLTLTTAADIAAVACAPGLDVSGVTTATVTIAVVAPTFSTSGAATSGIGSLDVTMSTTTTDASIYYSEGDGSQEDPACWTSALYDGPVTLTDQRLATVFKAVACKTGHVDSSVAESPVYSVRVASPLFSADYSAVNPVVVTLSSTTSDAELRYTTGDGSQAAPSCSSGTVGTTVELSYSSYVKAIACRANTVDSWVSLSQAYAVQVLAPTFTADSDSGISSVEVELATASEGATMYYTVGDGFTQADPDCDSGTGTLIDAASATLVVEEDATVKAVACRDGNEPSDVSEHSYVVQVAPPEFSVVFSDATLLNVSVSSATYSASVVVTDDGSEPSCSSGSSSEGVVVVLDRSATLTAVACKDGLDDSALTTETYVLTVASPQVEVVDVLADEFDVQISSETRGSYLVYTLGDGSEAAPTCAGGDSGTGSSTLVRCSTTGVLQVIACKDGLDDSEVQAVSFQNQVEAVVFAADSPGDTTLEVTLSTPTTHASIYASTTSANAVGCGEGTLVADGTSEGVLTLDRNVEAVWAVACRDMYLSSGVGQSPTGYEVSVADPEFSWAGGDGVLYVTVASPAEDSAVVIGADGGCDPDSSPASLVVPLTLSGTVTAQACRVDNLDSDVVTSAYYEVHAATPTFTVISTTADAVAVNVSTSSAGAEIFLADECGVAGEGVGSWQEIFVTARVTIEAIACRVGNEPSAVASLSVAPQAATPTFWSQVSGGSLLLVEVATETTDAEIRYSTNATLPSCASAGAGTLYTGDIVLSADAEVVAIACKDGLDDSELAYSGLYVVGAGHPEISCSGSSPEECAPTPDGSLTVAIDTSVVHDGVTIRYLLTNTTEEVVSCTSEAGQEGTPDDLVVTDGDVVQAISCRDDVYSSAVEMWSTVVARLVVTGLPSDNRNGNATLWFSGGGEVTVTANGDRYVLIRGGVYDAQVLATSEGIECTLSGVPGSQALGDVIIPLGCADAPFAGQLTPTTLSLEAALATDTVYVLAAVSGVGACLVLTCVLSRRHGKGRGAGQVVDPTMPSAYSIKPDDDGRIMAAAYSVLASCGSTRAFCEMMGIAPCPPLPLPLPRRKRRRPWSRRRRLRRPQEAGIEMLPLGDSECEEGEGEEVPDRAHFIPFWTKRLRADPQDEFCELQKALVVAGKLLLRRAELLQRLGDDHTAPSSITDPVEDTRINEELSARLPLGIGEENVVISVSDAACVRLSGELEGRVKESDAVRFFVSRNFIIPYRFSEAVTHVERRADELEVFLGAVLSMVGGEWRLGQPKLRVSLSHCLGSDAPGTAVAVADVKRDIVLLAFGPGDSLLRALPALAVALAAGIGTGQTALERILLGEAPLLDGLHPENRSPLTVLAQQAGGGAALVSFMSFLTSVFGVHRVHALLQLNVAEDCDVMTLLRDNVPGLLLGQSVESLELLWRKTVKQLAKQAELASAHDVHTTESVSLGTVFREVWRYLFTSKRKDTALCVLCILYDALHAIVFTLVLEYLFDDAIPNGHYDEMVFALALLFGLYLVNGAVNYFYATRVPGQLGYIRAKRLQMVQHLSRVSQAYHDATSTNLLMAVLTQDLAGVAACFPASFSFADGVVSLLALIPLLLVLSLPITMALLCLLPFAWRYLLSAGALVSDANTEYSRGEKRFLGTIEETLSMHMTSTLFGLNPYLTAKLKQQASQLGDKVKGLKLARARHARAVDNIATAFQMSTIIIGTYMTATGSLSVGTFVAFYHAVQQLAKHMSKLAASIDVWHRGGHHYAMLLHMQTVQERALGDATPDAFQHTLRVKGLSYSYADERRALRDVSFTLERPAENNDCHTVALVGKSGSGKSTLVKLLSRVYETERGSDITLDGVPLSTLVEHDYCGRVVAVMDQETVLFDRSVRENIRIGEPRVTDEEAERAAVLSGLDADVRDAAEGYDATVGQRGKLLSFGQRQRLGLARVLVRKAPILILDEPTSFQDADQADRLLESIISFAKNHHGPPYVIVFVTSQMQVASRFDDVIMLHEGSVAAHGPYQSLAADAKGVFAQMLRRQSGFTFHKNGRVTIAPARLLDIWLFAEANESLLTGVAVMFATKKITHATELAVGGDPLDTLFVVAKGSIIASMGESQVGAYHVGDFCGELGVVDPDTVEPRRLMASENSVILGLQHHYFANLLEQNEALERAVKRVVKARSRQLEVERLRSVWPFAALTPEETKGVISCFQTSVVQEGVALFDEHLPCASLYIVVTGSVLVQSVSPTGEPLRRLAQAGDCFGEVSVIQDCPRLLEAETATRSVLLSLQRNELADYMMASDAGNLARMKRIVATHEELLALDQPALSWLFVGIDDAPRRSLLLQAFKTRVVRPGQSPEPGVVWGIVYGSVLLRRPETEDEIVGERSFFGDFPVTQPLFYKPVESASVVTPCVVIEISADHYRRALTAHSGMRESVRLLELEIQRLSLMSTLRRAGHFKDSEVAELERLDVEQQSYVGKFDQVAVEAGAPVFDCSADGVAHGRHHWWVVVSGSVTVSSLSSSGGGGSGSGSGSGSRSGEDAEFIGHSVEAQGYGAVEAEEEEEEQEEEGGGRVHGSGSSSRHQRLGEEEEEVEEAEEKEEVVEVQTVLGPGACFGQSCLPGTPLEEMELRAVADDLCVLLRLDISSVIDRRIEQERMSERQRREAEEAGERALQLRHTQMKEELERALMASADEEGHRLARLQREQQWESDRLRLELALMREEDAALRAVNRSWREAEEAEEKAAQAAAWAEQQVPRQMVGGDVAAEREVLEQLRVQRMRMEIEDTHRRREWEREELERAQARHEAELARAEAATAREQLQQHAGQIERLLEHIGELERHSHELERENSEVEGRLKELHEQALRAAARAVRPAE